MHMSTQNSDLHCLAPTRLLLICDANRNSSAVLSVLGEAGHSVVAKPLHCPASATLRALLPSVDIVLLDVTNSTRDVFKTILQVNVAIGIGSLWPRLLCFSTARRNPQFELAVEKSGARYVRVDSAGVLLDAINLVLAETTDLERAGPHFEIVHSFWQEETGCAPGEAVTAVLLEYRGRMFQVPLALCQRLVFNFLACHSRLALDSLQIVSGLAGDWFYRDHASNSGHVQIAKIRRATVKVLVQRIREALASTFAEAHLRLEPGDVLRSCPVEGSKRILYKLRADVHWHHAQ